MGVSCGPRFRVVFALGGPLDPRVHCLALGVFVACRFPIGTNTHCALEGASAFRVNHLEGYYG